ncbi:MAG: tRNA (adenosine(37)-N6)-dimethylallyltransferase MiaA [Candidatus Pacebacteria bacterium]|nr:tRNA (adenosine(37)-N6)-dimethylallyltransferase MiaA [Candidatus Paceibacterota bacterium]
MHERIPISIICGPTASGKTARSVALARECGGEVISVDSRQVYRMLDIGTEKSTLEERQGVPHYLIDIRDPRKSYSAGEFVEDASALIQDIHSRGLHPILAGGTHFYFDALLHGIPENTPTNDSLRESLEMHSNQELLERIEKSDPERALELDPANRRRLIRALEIIELHGTVPKRTINSRYDVTIEYIDPGQEELDKRLRARLTEAFEKGLTDEVRTVRDYVGDARLNELGLEYRIVGEFLRGERDEETLEDALYAKLRQYARRQRAWLRKLTT